MTCGLPRSHRAAPPVRGVPSARHHGMRRSEALGLRWSDVDLGAGRASVVQTGHCGQSRGEDRLAENICRSPHDRPRFGHCRRIARAPATPGRRAAVNGRRLHRSRSRVLPPGRRAAAPGTVQSDIQRAGGKGWPAADPATRSPAHLGHARALGRCAFPPGRSGAPPATPRWGIALDTYSNVTDGLHTAAADLVAGMMTGVSNPLAAAAGEDHD